MRFLADESRDFGVVRTPRAATHDVMAISEISPRADDVDVMEFAVVEDRILLTEDKDFGQLVYAHGGKSVGLILLRYPALARKRICDDVINLVEKYGESLTGTFVVMQPGRTAFDTFMTRVQKILGWKDNPKLFFQDLLEQKKGRFKDALWRSVVEQYRKETERN